MSPGRWVDIGAPESLDFDQGAVVQVEGLQLALFPDGSGYRALDNICPHAGGPLAMGWLVDSVVVCPWHAWEFDIRTGRCVTSDVYHVRAYPVREVDGRLQVHITSRAPKAP